MRKVSTVVFTAVFVFMLFASLTSEANAANCAGCAANCKPVARDTTQATCKTEELIGGMGKKFVRGVTNVFTGWVEIPAQISKGYRRSCLCGAGVGVLTGIWYAAGRTFSGFYDMAGFWAADPKDNDGVGIPLDAEYVWEEGAHYSLTDPSFGVATLVPIGNKMARGLGNAAFGILEVPGQMMEGMRAKAFDAGIGKGLWYWFSREMDGVYDIATSVLPNPKDTMGFKFDQKWPWTVFKLD